MFEEFVQQPCYICGSVSQTSPQLGRGGTGKPSKHTSPHLYRLPTQSACARAQEHRSAHVYARLPSALLTLLDLWPKMAVLSKRPTRGRKEQTRLDGERGGEIEGEGEGDKERGGERGADGGDTQRCFLALTDKNNGLYCLCIYSKETLSSDSAVTQRIRFRRSNDTRRLAVRAVAMATHP